MLDAGRRGSVADFLPRAARFLMRRVKRAATISWGEILEGYLSVRRFRAMEVPPRCVLMIEPNEFHAELLPGYCDYFRRLGYEVVLIVRKKNRDSGAFARVPDKERPRMFAMGARAMRRCLRRGPIAKYEVAFFTSTVLAERHGYYGLFFDFLGFTPRGMHGYFAVEHSLPALMPAIESGRIELEQIFLLSPYRHEGVSVPMLNPHYFGATANHAVGNTRTFITVGSATSRNRDFQQLVAAVNALERQGVLDFRVLVIGGGAADMVGPASGRISALGYLGFEDLYSALERADFFLPLLDPENQGHRRYLSGETTGSRQLILGFGVVPVINDVFAEAYRFDETNAVLYSGKSLAEGMLRSIRMPPNEYAQRRSRLADLAAAVRDESVRNLSERLAAVGSGAGRR